MRVRDNGLEVRSVLRGMDSDYKRGLVVNAKK